VNTLEPKTIFVTVLSKNSVHVHIQQITWS